MSSGTHTDADELAQELEEAADDAHDALYDMADKIRSGGDLKTQRQLVIVECGRVEKIVNRSVD